MGRCFLCDPPADMPDEAFYEHMLEVHELDVEAEMQRWPDGRPVIIDESLQPVDFEDGAA